jgi:hypothetical protein
MLCVNPFNLYNTKKKKLSADELMIYTEIRPNPRFFGEGRDRIAMERKCSIAISWRVKQSSLDSRERQSRRW